MDSREFGLVAAQQLFHLQDLHFGFWEENTTPQFSSFLDAQNKHTDFLFTHIKNALDDKLSGKILDAGCGIGITTKKLLEMDFNVDGLVPSNWMATKARENVKKYTSKTKGNIYECTFEDFPMSNLSEKYKGIFFSESYQYVNMQQAFNNFDKILTADGKVIIFDFFKIDKVKGKSPHGGGHSIGEFYDLVTKNGYKINVDLDITKNLSPNITLVNELLTERLIPFGASLDLFLTYKLKAFYTFLKYIFRKKLAKIKYKYSQQRNKENFEKYKTYRLIVLEKIKD